MEEKRTENCHKSTETYERKEERERECEGYLENKDGGWASKNEFVHCVCVCERTQRVVNGAAGYSWQPSEHWRNLNQL